MKIGGVCGWKKGRERRLEYLNAGVIEKGGRAHMQQSLAALEDFHVGSFCFHNRLVVSGARFRARIEIKKQRQVEIKKQRKVYIIKKQR